MPQTQITFEPGRMYHIWTHANGSENLFRSDENCDYFMNKYTHYIQPVANTFAYCLMPNHLHLMVRVKDAEEVLVFLRTKKSKPNLQGFENPGGFRNVIGRMMPISDEAGRITGFVKILMDQTEKKKYQQELKTLNETLEERVSDRTEALLTYQRQLRFLVSELNTTVDRERDRLAGDLHDNLGQLLAVCKMELRMLQNQIDDKELQASISKATELIEEAIRYTRGLMSDLKPPEEVKKDLGRLMSWLAKRKERFDLKVIVEDDQQEKPLKDDVQALVFQAVRELLFNVVKHAGVDEAVVRLERQGENLRVLVEDKGKGFEPGKQEPVQESEGGFGLFNLRERLDLMGGSLDIESEPGKGTRATLVVPLNLNGS